ncbi:MAG: NAD-binding protein [Oscillospiraceae bacterium]|nr:NAD-binding protein [Oscillospiraceae bacterium]
MKKKALLIGGNNQTKYLANSLIKQGYHVVAINNDIEVCQNLSELGKLNVFQGDGSIPPVLEEAGAQGADLAVVITEHDDDNLVICELCKKIFHVKKTISLISNPQKADFSCQLGIDFIICPAKSIISIIEQQRAEG